ncbi:alpha/beta-hydrolase [Parathielavia hyrcaniae]|uniref:Alpha/beta-hydrolase n=1 Tax=Parathielavia hyrcaniae TaxID=113614 RepID=A0AAN6PR46_9PEZI|nr:alpha/beta-hydrolase [Parathielavia hyrcaniae]
MLSLQVLFGLLACATLGSSQDSQHEGLQKARSLFDPRVSLSFKRTHSCETTPGVKSYSGYVNLPANPAEGRPYNIHSFFWFFEARKNPEHAPLSLWLQGGPGAGSMPYAVGGNGPCSVTRNSRDTVLNPWSWNNEVNMLYLDQPVQTGFSYNTLINGTVDETQIPPMVTPLLPSSPAPELNSTFLLGVFASQDSQATANTTANAALAAWHFMQIWTQQFPKYKPRNRKLSIWTQSYGGHYGPTFANFFTEQTRKIEAGTLPPDTVPLRVDTVGIVNGCVDILTQLPSYAQMAHNNTYGIQIIDQNEYEAALARFPECERRVQACRSLARSQDPAELGHVEAVNAACSGAYYYCYGTMGHILESRGRNVYDIVQTMPESFPTRYAGGYFNSKEVQLELGVPLNMSGIALTVWNAFMQTGDFVLGNNIPYLGSLLDEGVKVALVYGDRDFQCSWYGGEQVSLAIESRASERFWRAGYATIRTNSTYVGGYVRQHGNLSFARVFDAGHEAPWYQPETTYRIFMRVMFDRDVATGRVSTAWPRGHRYATDGPASVANVTNAVPAQREPECYLWAIFLTCTQTQTEMLRNGTAIVKDYIMIGYHKADGGIHY